MALGGSIPASVFNIAFFDDAADVDHEKNEAAKVEVWLESLGLGRYITSLRDEGFDHFNIIQDLEEDNVDELIKHCKMPRLHARQFRRGLERVMAENMIADYAWASGGDATAATDEVHSGGTDGTGGLVTTKVATSAGLEKEEEGDENERLNRQKKNMTLHNKCTKSTEKNKRKRINKKVAREQEWDSLLKDLEQVGFSGNEKSI